MKKYAAILVFLAVATLCGAQNRETRKVDTFTRLSFRLPGKVYLKQGSEQKVELEGPKDVLAEIETEVSGGKLVIGKDNWTDWNWGRGDKYKIIAYITMKDIDGLSVSGSGDMIAEGPITVEDLRLSVSGSGLLQLEAKANGNVEADVSGSGNIDLKGSCRNFDSDISGSGDANVSLTIRGDADFGISGSGKIVASGTVIMLKANISGSGRVYADNMVADKCDIRISGSGDVKVNVKEEIEANIYGSGSVSYKGNPARINTHSSGSGGIHKM